MELNADQLISASVEDLVKTIRTSTSDGRGEGPKAALQWKLMERLVTALNRLTDSNLAASASNEKYARKMTMLTWALVFATMFQAIAAVLALCHR
jgi:hypothetical protein